MSNEALRLREIINKIKDHNLLKDRSCKNIRETIEDLGPTFIKMGQILSARDDLVSKELCDELKKLRCSVKPMDYDEVLDILNAEYNGNYQEIFAEIEEVPLGSASIAQTHRAKLKTGEDVVLKIQRKNIYQMMMMDTRLLKKAISILQLDKVVGNIVDLKEIVDEVYSSAKEEMNFMVEAEHIEEFENYNKNVMYIRPLKVYKKYSTPYVLVMECVGGCFINEKTKLDRLGYNMNEIALKLADNYIKQAIDDGFFHADPHPGNLRIRDGKIVWLDMGMMGRLTPRDKSLIAKAVKAIARGNNSELVDVILALGIFHGKPNRIRLYTDIEGLMTRYGTLDIGSIDIAALLTELIEIMSANELAMPAQLTLLARGMTTIEGVIADLSPQVNIVEVASGRISASFWENVNWKEELKNEGSQLYRSINRAMDIPVLMADLLQSYRNNETRIKLDLHATEDLSQMLEKLVSKMVMGLVIAALLLASSILCTTQMQPHLFGIPALGFLGYIMALGLAGYLVWEHFKNKNK